jgi:hypothetical protein
MGPAASGETVETRFPLTSAIRTARTGSWGEHRGYVDTRAVKVCAPAPRNRQPLPQAQSGVGYTFSVFIRCGWPDGWTLFSGTLRHHRPPPSCPPSRPPWCEPPPAPPSCWDESWCGAQSSTGSELANPDISRSWSRRSRSADFQSVYPESFRGWSQVFNLLAPRSVRTIRRLQICDTADWKSALRSRRPRAWRRWPSAVRQNV